MMNGLWLRASCAFCALILNKNYGMGSTGMEWFLGFVEWLFSETFIADLRPEMWVSLAAISVAVWTGRQSQQHAGLSVIPAFSVWGEYPTGANRRCKILVANKGFGPAIIDRVELFFNKDRIDGYMYEKVQSGIKQAFGGHVVDVERSATEEKGHAFGADREIELARFVVTEELVQQGAQGIGERLRPMTLTIRYSDIYGRKWYFLVREFEGVTWRRNSPAHLVNLLRYRPYLK